tara:strand:+ start:53 stop:517 length:465 start_codon:yes stop_codon:yes gene_type:complete
MKIDYSENEDIYYCDLKLKSLKNYGKTKQSNTLIRIDFHTLFDKPTFEQENALNYLIENEEDIFKIMNREIVKTYNNKILKKFEKFKEFLPVIKTESDLHNEISITDILVSGNSETDFAFVLFKGECSWDIEHGFCVAMHKKKFIELGSWDYYY